MRIRWIEALYGFSPEQTHIAVPANAEQTLLTMVDELVGTNDLIAIYIPEGTEDVYDPRPGSRGRVIGAVRLVEMPEGGSITDYFFKDWDGSMRWPVGWPCEVVYAPDVESCPVLRTQVDFLHGDGAFQPYVARFQKGPFRLDPRMSARLTELLAPFHKLA